MFKKISLAITALLATSTLFSQTTVCLGTDASECIGEPITIETCPGGGGLTSSVYTLTNPSTYSLGDDDYTQLIPLGFNFEYYGNTYSQITVSDNGQVSFNAANANGYSSWVVGTIPSTVASVQNSILAVWQDLYQPAGGNIYYETIGTAPNRIGVVYWDGLSMFSTSCQLPNLCYTGAVLLFEGTNVIETHISNKTTCTSWGNGTATHGLNNINGTVAHVVPGRNNTNFSIQNDGYRFSPDGLGGYTLMPIPFSVVTTSTNNGIVWNNTNGTSFPYNNGVLNTTVQSGTVGYFIASSTCGTGVGALSDTTFITGLSFNVSGSAVDDQCSAGIGSVTVVATNGTAPYTYLWPGLNNATTPTVNNVSAGNYTVEVTDANGCTNSITIPVGNNPVSFPTSVTTVSCPGGSDGTATAQMSPVLGNISYQWNDPNNQTTSTATGLAAGTYDCLITSDVGCSETVTVTVTEIPGMNVQVVNQVDVTCNSGNDGIAEIAVTAGTPPYTYSWTGSNSITNIATDLFVGTTTVTITDSNGCIVTQDITLDQPNALAIGDFSKDTIICIDDSVKLFAQGTGGSSPYIYNWSSNGQNVGTGNVIYVTPTSASTEYCLTLSEQCGSPVDVKCVMVDYPAEVIPNLSPDKTGECFPIEVEFSNTTNTTETINYTIWTYSDGTVDTVAGENPATHEFGLGVFDVEMEVVTDRGCRYTNDFPSLIEGFPYPEADFYVNPNPASIFEPKVGAYSQSSSDIISYEWFAEGAIPSYSSIQNPTFEYPNVIENYPLILVVQNAYGCEDTLTKLVRIENEVMIFSPNTFTPDGDGFNDTWRVHILGIDIQNFRLEIYNRWGEKVFESLDPEAEWDGTYGGKIVKDGTYLWTIKAYDFETDNKYEFNGSILILK